MLPTLAGTKINECKACSPGEEQKPCAVKAAPLRSNTSHQKEKLLPCGATKNSCGKTCSAAEHTLARVLKAAPLGRNKNGQEKHLLTK